MQGENPDSQKFFQTSRTSAPSSPSRSWGGGGAPLAPGREEQRHRADICRRSAHQRCGLVGKAEGQALPDQIDHYGDRSTDGGKDRRPVRRLESRSVCAGPEMSRPRQSNRGAVAGAVPGLLGPVPLQLAAQVGAADVHGVERPRLVPVDPGLFPVEEHDPAVSGRDIFGRLCWDLEESLDHTLDGLPRPPSGCRAAQRGPDGWERKGRHRGCPCPGSYHTGGVAAAMEEVMPHFWNPVATYQPGWLEE